MSARPISMQDVLEAHARLRPHLAVTPCMSHPLLDHAVGAGVQVWVKHENHQPTGAFKVRNALSALTALPPEDRQRGVAAATRGNHGAGLAYAGRKLGVPVTVVVPQGNNPEKNALIKGLGATLVELGRDYDEAANAARVIIQRDRLTAIHSTNNPHVLAGAATLFLEMLEQAPDLDAVVVSVGGGSQAVGAMTVAAGLLPGLEIYAVQAEGAPATHDSWHARAPRTTETAITMADGLATRSTYELTFPALLEGLEDFVTVSEPELAAAVRILIKTTHNLVEPAGAAGLAGLMKLRARLAGKRVGIVLSGGNVDSDTLTRILNAEL